MKLSVKMLLIGAVAVTALAATGPAKATGPWCAIINLGRGGSQEQCGFATFEACRREAQIFGSSSFCRQNNWYAPFWGVGPEPARHVKVKRRHHHAH